MRLVRKAQEEAAKVPGGADLAELLAEYRERSAVSPEEYRERSGRVIGQVQEMSYLLGQLAALTGGR